METQEPASSREGAWSEIEVANVRDCSRLVVCRCVAPVKAFNPGHDDKLCQVILSNYGGGLVQGDIVRLRFHCRENASAYLGTQANTRVYRADDGKDCLQEVCGTLDAGSRAIVLPDPLVLHAGSRLRQVQEWTVAEDAELILGDTIHPGRMDTGEIFEYETYESRIRIHGPDGLLVRDDFRLDRTAADPPRVGVMGQFRIVTNIYLVGTSFVARMDRVRHHLAPRNTLTEGGNPGYAKDADGAPVSVVSISNHRDRCVLVRALMHNHQQGQRFRQALDALVQELAPSPHHPWQRLHAGSGAATP